MTPNETPGFDPERFIRTARWQKAARPFGGDPHEYMLRRRAADPGEHDRMIEHIETNGEPAVYAGSRYRYFACDGYLLWTSRAVFPPYGDRIINRRPVTEGE